MIREQLSQDAIFGIKAGDVATQNLLGFKAAGFWRQNREIGGDSHQATIVLVDPSTGRPLSIIDGNTITTLRTGAAGGLALRHLARADSTQLCVFGTGVQALVQTQFALRVMPGLQHLRFDADAIRPGTHLNCVGADTKGKRELPDGLLRRARVFVDAHAQVSAIGELQWSPDVAAEEFGDVLTADKPFLRDPQDITLFDMTGLALQDLTVARMLMTRAAASQSGIRIAWPW